MPAKPRPNWHPHYAVELIPPSRNLNCAALSLPGLKIYADLYPCEGTGPNRHKPKPLTGATAISRLFGRALYVRIGTWQRWF